MRDNRFSKSRKTLALLLAVTMLLSMVPAMTVAAETLTEQATQTQTVTAGDPTISRTAFWEFSAANQLSDFSLYQSGTSNFTVADGMLVPNGVDGELKAILTNTPSNIRSVSVDILPGESGSIYGGLYIGASGAGAAVDEINSMIFLIQSNFTGWADAPNRIDIIQGQFGEGWKELSRTVSEAGNGNALFSGGNKQFTTELYKGSYSYTLVGFVQNSVVFQSYWWALAVAVAVNAARTLVDAMFGDIKR